MIKKIKFIIAGVGILALIAVIFWFSTQTQNIKETQTTQSRADDNTASYLCSWTTDDTKKHTFEVAIVDLAGNIIVKERVSTNASSPSDLSEYKFTNVPKDKLIGVRCQVQLVDGFCNPVTSKDPDICSSFSTPTVTESVATTITPTGTLTATATPGSATATPGDGTATPRSSTATPAAATATATPAAATATAAAKATATAAPSATAAAATGVAATATKAAAATSTSAASTATAAATSGITSGATNTTAQSSTTLPSSGTVHPAIILGLLSLFIIALGLVL